MRRHQRLNGFNVICCPRILKNGDQTPHTTMKTGHFYFGKNRTFLNWLDISVLVGCLISLLIVSCASVHRSSSETDGRLISRDVLHQPGAAAWSPDSTRLAFITNNKLTIFNIDSGVSEAIPGIQPMFIAWAPGENLLVVNKAAGMSELVRVNTADGTQSSVSLQDSPIAAIWLYPPDTFIVFSSELKRYSIGTIITNRLVRKDAGEGSLFFSRDTYIPTRKKDIDAVSGWTYAGLRPIHDTVLLPEYHSPPRMDPFTVIKTIDPVIDEETEITRFISGNYSIPASWSPDGSRLAIANDEGLLHIINAEHADNMQAVNPDITGRFPAWNPRGDQIFLGGWLLDSDGFIEGQLISGAFDSIGVWSPEGTKLAIIAGTDLFYFDQTSPSFKTGYKPAYEDYESIRDKVHMLKKLYNQGLLSKDEFRIRRSRLIRREAEQ